ncbi:4-amino-4-deoxy-L-arabinose-phosphoundecaprenol flippase subunit ArnF [Acerihabitans sp. TG2]|uniref:4-amino-4-deoxy-L-arabinose-phosphoundecaprenol flippase subunit ArnF n=1 Tax=Acerihabitans sp. TG2 TaxID=3096008 RepID=UPI002B224316|nr:4-amino-4-deoxy-L-arabinose-phosphoundecaprenol flippase subunit ArnF [Acerihabitans sp. TG2]MEA9390518.1 4-amino-4-deoxy-L-arabinose-phosphoundecaprenol flippase subunit ArnF [Acerihabitans sp. TG2]
MKGYAWATCSIILVTLAQLLMKWGMQHLPLLSLRDISPSLLFSYPMSVLAVAGGIAGYALSMLCWFYALLYLPLSLAYPLLSISYALVYAAAVFLPGFNEPATVLKTLGVGFILFGVSLINKSHK